MSLSRRACAAGLALAACWPEILLAADAPTPLLKPIVISAHRAGGRTYAPDNSMANIEHALASGVNMIEIDLRPTSDGGLVLWHDASSPRAMFFPDDVSGQRLAIRRLSLDEALRLRYGAVVGNRKWVDVGLVNAEAMIERYKDRLNFHLDVKETPAKRVLQLIASHGIEKRVIVMCKDLEYLRAIKRANPKLVVEWTQNTLGRYEKEGKWLFLPAPQQIEEYHKALRALSGIGGEMLCTKGLTAEKVQLCHRYGVAVRPSAGHVKAGDGKQFLQMGVDGILGDNPQAVMACVRETLGKDYVAPPGMTVAEIVGANRKSE